MQRIWCNVPFVQNLVQNGEHMTSAPQAVHPVEVPSRNAERERQMAERGRRRAEAMIRKSEERGEAAETPAGAELVRRAVVPVDAAITAFVDAAYSGRAGRKATAAKLLQGVDHEKAAYLAVKVALNGAMRRGSLKAVALETANCLEIELLGDAFEAQNRPLYKAVERRAKSKGLTPQRIAKAVELASKRFEIDYEVWTYDEKIQLGTKLIELVIEHTGGLIKAPHVRLKHNRSGHVVSFGEGFEDWYNAFNKSAALSRPLWLPTLAPPKPWEGVRGGGYETNVIRAPAIISRSFKGQLKLLKDAIMPDVYEGLNGIQETPWRINARVLAVMTEAWEKGLPLPAIPSREDVPLPEKPVDIETNEEARKAYREEARKAHQKNAQLRSERFAFSRIVNIAAENREEEVIYFPHRLDFRGRCYAMSTALHPQGPDEARALLEFSEGKPLGERGLFWLGVHGANVFGNDKVSLEERYQWAIDNADRVAQMIVDPLNDLWWTEADKPWSFLAWAFEWGTFYAMAFADFPAHTFVSHLPIALDGSCNGIQHYSAMLRDEVGGAAVNLVPSDKPQDIYQEVADRVIEKLADVAAKLDHPDHFFAYQWLHFGIDRKITKRAVMVLPYGGTFKSCMDYVSDAVMERLASGQENPFGDALMKALGYLAKLVWESISDVVIAARAAMKWLQDVSRICTKAGVPIRWTTPTGFIAVQDYREVSGRLIETRFMGKIMKYRSTETTDRINGDKQASALAPNVVHSLDAAAMMRTIVAAKAEGITSFAMIHDSYGTHAADTERFSAILRECFVDMYSETDFLEHFRDEIAEQLPVEVAATLPPLPAKGSLDLSEVLRSRYFFA